MDGTVKALGTAVLVLSALAGGVTLCYGMGVLVAPDFRTTSAVGTMAAGVITVVTAALCLYAAALIVVGVGAFVATEVEILHDRLWGDQ